MSKMQQHLILMNQVYTNILFLSTTEARNSKISHFDCKSPTKYTLSKARLKSDIQKTEILIANNVLNLHLYLTDILLLNTV